MFNKLRKIFLPSIFLLIAFPSLVSAQTDSLHKFSGTVTIEGKSPDGVIVTAIIDGLKAGSSKVLRGRYALSVEQPAGMNFSGRVISFEVDGNPVKNTRRWKPGGAETLDLLVKSTQEITSTPRPWVKPISTPNPRSKVKPTLEPTVRSWARPNTTPNPGISPVKATKEPATLSTRRPQPIAKDQPDLKDLCFDVRKYEGAPKDEGTIIRTLDRVPVSGGDAVSLTGTIYYDGKLRILRVFNDNGLWGYLIAQKWQGVPRILKDNPGTICVISNTTQNNLPDSKPERTSNSPIKTGVDLAVFINSGSGREKIDLMCSGISSKNDEAVVRCQMLEPDDPADARVRSGPNQWPIIVKNNGDDSASGYIVDIVLSSDLTAPVQYAAPLGPIISEDVLIDPGRLDNGPPLGKNSSAVIHLGIGPLPNGIRPGKHGLCAVVDPGNLLEESNEKNNVFCLPVEIREFSNDKSGFSGTVVIDHNPAPAGTMVASYVEGQKISESAVTDGFYSLRLEQPQGESFEGEIVEFRLFLPGTNDRESKEILLSQTSVWRAGNIENINFEIARQRGFLINPPIGDIGSSLPWNSIDTNTLSIVGIILTLLTAGIPLFRGD